MASRRRFPRGPPIPEVNQASPEAPKSGRLGTLEQSNYDSDTGGRAFKCPLNASVLIARDPTTGFFAVFTVFACISVSGSR